MDLITLLDAGNQEAVAAAAAADSAATAESLLASSSWLPLSSPVTPRTSIEAGGVELPVVTTPPPARLRDMAFASPADQANSASPQSAALAFVARRGNVALTRGWRSPGAKAQPGAVSACTAPAPALCQVALTSPESCSTLAALARLSGIDNLSPAARSLESSVTGLQSTLDMSGLVLGTSAFLGTVPYSPTARPLIPLGATNQEEAAHAYLIKGPGRDKIVTYRTSCAGGSLTLRNTDHDTVSPGIAGRQTSFAHLLDF